MPRASKAAKPLNCLIAIKANIDLFKRIKLGAKQEGYQFYADYFRILLDKHLPPLRRKKEKKT
jgi:hypothetical protein